MAGDSLAQRQVCEGIREIAYGTASGRVDRSTADDVVQQVVLEVMSDIPRLLRYPNIVWFVRQRTSSRISDYFKRISKDKKALRQYWEEKKTLGGYTERDSSVEMTEWLRKSDAFVEASPSQVEKSVGRYLLANYEQQPCPGPTQVASDLGLPVHVVKRVWEKLRHRVGREYAQCNHPRL